MPSAHTSPDLPGTEVKVAEFPAPLCGSCAAPMWLRKRIFHAGPPYSQLRLGFVCPTCGSKMKLHGQQPVALSS